MFWGWLHTLASGVVLALSLDEARGLLKPLREKYLAWRNRPRSEPHPRIGDCLTNWLNNELGVKEDWGPYFTYAEKFLKWKFGDTVTSGLWTTIKAGVEYEKYIVSLGHALTGHKPVPERNTEHRVGQRRFRKTASGVTRREVWTGTEWKLDFPEFNTTQGAFPASQRGVEAAVAAGESGINALSKATEAVREHEINELWANNAIVGDWSNPVWEPTTDDVIPIED